MRGPHNPPVTRLGAISFINTIPIYYGFHQDCPIQPPAWFDSLSLHYAPPSALNGMMDREELDVSPVSSAFYLRNKARFTLLSDLSVSSPGAVDSVVLLSKIPLGPSLLELSHIGVPDASETSIALLTHLLQEKVGQIPSDWLQVYPASQHRDALNQYQAILMIGDEALKLVDDGVPRGYHCYDLATLWQQQQRLPFVFAVWIAQNEWAESHPDALRELNAYLSQVRAWFFANPQTVGEGVRLAKTRCPLSEERLYRYFTQSLNYELTADHRQSLDMFESILRQLDHPSTVLSAQAVQR